MYETNIAWTDSTFNPWMGCTKIDPGCANCYAEKLVTNRMGLDLWGPNGRRQRTTPQNWRKPIGWNAEAQASKQRRKVFCASLCDIFEYHPIADATRPDLWELIRKTPWLDWQLLTKRPQRILANLPADWGNGWPNVWLGTSICESNGVWRADVLRTVPAKVRFVSYEPALGPIAPFVHLDGIHWVIYGGESGPGFRRSDIQWARDIRDKCREEGVAFFFKQEAAFRPGSNPHLDGETIKQFPT